MVTARESGLSGVRRAFVESVDAVVELLDAPATAERWNEPSVLTGMTVGDLAAHLARNACMVLPGLNGPSSQLPVRRLLEHYAASPWVVAAPDEEANVQIRRAAAAIARSGPPVLLEQVRQAGAQLRQLLRQASAAHAIAPPGRDWALLLDDYLVARMIEVVVHLDDLAVSLDLPLPPVPEAAIEVVSQTLLAVSRWRHGSMPVLRALSRAERAPKSISAF